MSKDGYKPTQDNSKGENNEEEFRIKRNGKRD